MFNADCYSIAFNMNWELRVVILGKEIQSILGASIDHPLWDRLGRR
jgi:hypothetical protein